MIHNSRLAALFGLEGKVAVVTGAASGIGHGIARLFNEAGAKVVVADRNLAAAQEVAGELQAAGGEAIAIGADVSDKASVAGLFTQTRERLGPVDVLVNNAGIFPAEPFLETTPADLDRMVSVNVRGVLLCMQEAIRLMQGRSGGGSIVNISSSASRRPVIFDNATYAASKAGVDSLTRSAAMEFAGQGIRVNSVAPGGIRTEGSLARRAASLRGPFATPGRMLLGRVGVPEDIAAAVLFLASSASSYVTGQVLLVDGGFELS